MFVSFFGTLRAKFIEEGCRKMIKASIKMASAATIVLVIGLSAIKAQAARVDARKLSCSQAQSLVQERGSVVMTFTPTTYDKIVKNRWFCDIGDNTRSFYTPTADNPRCLVGKKCVPRSPGIGRR